MTPFLDNFPSTFGVPYSPDIMIPKVILIQTGVPILEW